MGKFSQKKWWLSVAERAIKTFAEVLLSYVGIATFISDVNWGVAFSASAMGVIASVLINIISLPPIQDDSSSN